MKKITALLFFCALLSASYAQQYARARVSLLGKTMEDLARMGVETDHGEYRPGQSFTTDLSYADIDLLKKAGFETEIVIADVTKWYAEQKQPLLTKPASERSDCGTTPTDPNAAKTYQTPANYTYGSMGGYHTYSEMLTVLEDMAAKYPKLITKAAKVSDTILTHEGRSLLWVRISDNPQADENGEPEVLYTALHHAREPNGLSQMLFYMWYLLENYDKDETVRYLVNNTEMYFIPCVNPDGYIHNEKIQPNGGGFWRKNRRNNGDGTFGVDLNRNYGYKWGDLGTGGSSGVTASDTYCGPSAMSEPETRSVGEFCKKHNFKFALNYHTSGNLLIYPWAYSDAAAFPELKTYAKIMTRENNFTYGTSTETVGYRVNGSSDDWMLAERDINSFTPEVGPSAYGFWPPKEAIDGLNKSNVWQNLITALSPLRYAVAEAQAPLDLASLASLTIPVTVTRYGQQDGPFVLSFEPLTAGTALPDTQQTIHLSQFNQLKTQVTLQPNPSTPVGATIKMLLRLSGGGFSRTDTLTFVYAGPPTTLFQDNINGDQAWNKEWSLTNEQYVSAPTSMTDSPNGKYQPNSYKVLKTTESFELPLNAMKPQLQFMARWAIQPDFDYVQVIAEDEENQVSFPLCGLHTRSGGKNQAPGQPLFDGFQNAWVAECMDLSLFKGSKIKIQFALNSDGQQEYDGFYFDDVKITYINPTSFVKETKYLDGFTLKTAAPNPAADVVTLSWENPGNIGGDARVSVYDHSGKEVLSQSFVLNNRSQMALDTRSLREGIYFYQIKTAQGVSAAQKVLILRP